MSQKYGPRRFQRRVARLSTTKTRPCSSNQTFAHLGQMCTLWKKKTSAFKEGSANRNDGMPVLPLNWHIYIVQTQP